MSSELLRPRTVLGCVLIPAIIALASCAERTPSEPGPSIPDPRPFTAGEQAVSSANNAFGLELLRRLHESETGANIFISPLSASMALGMAMNGAEGETFESMRRTLGFGDLSRDEVAAAYGGLIGQLRARDPVIDFRLANSVWAREGFPFEESFMERSRRDFSAEVRTLDFASPAAPGEISRWAEEATGGRIKDLVEEIDPLDIMFLVNAVYFKGPWAEPFEPTATRPQPFHLAGGGTVDVPMMMQDAAFRWFENGEASGVELLYADGGFSMVLLMPAEGRPLEDLVDALDPLTWEEWTGSFQASRLMLFVPKFRLEYEAPLRPVLADMGMGIAFEPWQADFSGISRARDDIHISAVKQKSFIDVHELGTEAAAATSVTVGVTSMPPTLTFDRPFLYAIRERESGTILFIGRMGDPSAG